MPRSCFLPLSVLLAAALLLLPGCPQTPPTDLRVDPESESGPDQAASGANGLFDTVLTDSIDAEHGDTTDYKYIQVDAPGAMDVHVRFHDTDVSGTVAVLNEYGELLLERPVTAGGAVDIEDFSVLPGRYFLRIRASSGASDYSVGRELTRDPTWLSTDDRTWVDQQLAAARERKEAGDFAGARVLLDEIAARFPGHPVVSGQVADERTEVDEAERLAQIDDDGGGHGGHGGHGGDHGNGDDGNGTGGGDGDQGTGGGDGDQGGGDGDQGTSRGIRANIVTQRDRGAGLGTTLVLTGCGTSSGLSEGDSGLIQGTRQHATITRQLGGTNCEAETDASPGEIRSARYVEF